MQAGGGSFPIFSRQWHLLETAHLAPDDVTQPPFNSRRHQLV
jgi:hypothetical protein